MTKNLFKLSLLLIFLSGMSIRQTLLADQMTATPTVDPYMDFKGPCHDDPRIVGKSFTFKGRASYLNGNLTSLKIWMIGTHRIVGVRDGCPIPENLSIILKDDLNVEVYGTFTVYPITPFKKGVMQFVCVDTVKITKVIKGTK